MSNQTNEKLEKLVAILERVPKTRVYMLMWRLAPETKPFDPDNSDCGFAGCGIGWAIHAGIVPELTWGQHGEPRFDDPIIGHTAWGWKAVEEAFGLTSNEAQFLFDPFKYIPREAYQTAGPEVGESDLAKEYATRDAVVARIKNFIEEGM